MKNKVVLYFGMLVPLIFWSTILSCGLVTENYDHFSNLVSELGAIGTGTRFVFTAGLVLCALLSVFFIAGLYSTAKELDLNTIPVLLLLTFSFSVLGAAIFPLPNRWHGILGSPVMVLPLSPLLTMILWKTSVIRDIKTGSLVCLLLMLSGFLTFMPILYQYPGLTQRFFHIGWTVWFVYLSKRFVTLNRNLMERREPIHYNEST